MSLKFNVNKIHSDLSSSFEEVEISEKSSLKWGNHIELLINENKVQLRAIISKRNLENKDFNWAYFSNPEDDSTLVERSSNVDSFIDDVKDIFEKNRFDSEYIKNVR